MADRRSPGDVLIGFAGKSHVADVTIEKNHKDAKPRLIHSLYVHLKS